MITNRELLELVAKAAGYKIHMWGTKGEESAARMDVESTPRWNPLINDGDAFRLAVKLRIKFAYCDEDVPEVNITAGSAVAEAGGTCFVESTSAKPEEACRRAIVLAAAEIGRAMP